MLYFAMSKFVMMQSSGPADRLRTDNTGHSLFQSRFFSNESEINPAGCLCEEDARLLAIYRSNHELFVLSHDVVLV